MKIAAVTVVAIAALVAAVPGQGSHTTPVLKVTDRLSPGKPVAPFSIGDVRVDCPRGYVATGGAVWEGANEPVLDGPTTNGRGWEASVFNHSDSTVYNSNVQVVCAKGTRLKVRTAMTAGQRRAIIQDFLDARK